MNQIRAWFQRTSTHKCATVFVYIGCLIFAVVVFIGWFHGLENAVGMMNCVAMVVLVNSVQYAGKAGFEHSKWATPLITGAISGLVSGDPAAGISNAISTIQAQEQMQASMNTQYTDPASAPSASDMPADGTSQTNDSSPDSQSTDCGPEK